MVKIKVRDYGLSEVEQDELWRRWRDGQSVSSIGRELGKPFQHLRRFMAQTGGVRPPVPRPARWHLSLSEREEISRGIAAEQSARTIAERLGRRASTVSREISRHGGRETYRAQGAHQRAAGNRRRPKTAELAGAPVLRAVVEAKLGLCWSPDEIRAPRRCPRRRPRVHRVPPRALAPDLVEQPPGYLEPGRGCPARS